MDEKRRQEAISWCRDQLDFAQENLDLITQGRLSIRVGDGSGTPFKDVTEQHRVKHAETVDRMKKLIAAYEKA